MCGVLKGKDFDFVKFLFQSSNRYHEDIFSVPQRNKESKDAR